MTTTPNPSLAGSAASTILTILSNSSGYVTLGLQLAGVFVPLIKGLVTKIEGIGSGSVTISFTELLASDAAELDAIAKLSSDDLTSINAELARMGYPPLPNPPAPVPVPPEPVPAPAPAPEPGPAPTPVSAPEPPATQ